MSVYWFNRGGAGAANFLYETAHTAASWGEAHDRPQGFVSFGHEPLVRRILDPEQRLPYWNEHDAGGHFPAMEVPDALRRRPAGVLCEPALTTRPRATRA